MQIQQTLQIPSFTLYPITTSDMKTCYQSASNKILCSLNGPYFERKISRLEPYFNIQINQAQFNNSSTLAAQQLTRLQKKVQQILSEVVIAGKYQRMIFDINIEIIQFNTLNPLIFLLSPILNLLSYTCMLKCLEISSAFSCSAAILRNEKIIWQYNSQCSRDNNDNILIICSDQRDKRSILTYFEGTYNFSNYQKLASGLQQSNEQINRFQLEKVNQVYDLFHQ